MRLILPLFALAVSGCAVKVQHTGLESPMASSGYSDGFAEGSGSGSLWTRPEVEPQVDPGLYGVDDRYMLDPRQGVIDVWDWELMYQDAPWNRPQEPFPLP